MLTMLHQELTTNRTLDVGDVADALPRIHSATLDIGDVGDA